jgi:hypothetical protein
VGRGDRGPGAIVLHMNLSIPTNYHETGEWLLSFVRSHAKRESARVEALLEAAGPREGHSYGVRLSLGARVHPPLGSPPIELEFREVVEGRTRFAWCLALAARVRATARELAGTARSAG